MNWRFWEKTENRDYTSVLIDAFLQRAASSTTVLNQIPSYQQGAIEAAVGWWSRGFAAIRLIPGLQIGADMLAEIGRGLCSRGESIWYIDRSGRRLRYRVVSTYEVRTHGNMEYYQVTMSLPDRLETLSFVSPKDVLHFRYSIDPIAPWRGIGPLQLASQSVDVLSKGERHFAKELSSAVGNLLPQPSAPGSEDVKGLKESLRDLDGRTAIVQTQKASWGQQGGQNDADWRLTRLGAKPERASVILRGFVENSIYAACGIPPGLFSAASESSVRDSWRLFLLATIGPFSKMLAEEISEKLVPVKIDMAELRSADVATMARAVHSLVQAGYSKEEAMAHVQAG